MSKDSKKLSFEFFPPKTQEGKEKLKLLAKKLELFSPEYYSVTFGAGGSTRDGTLDACVLLSQLSTQICPHVSGITSTKEEISEILSEYSKEDLNRLVVLRGDLPSGMASSGDFPYAVDLIKFIKETQNDKFYIEVAAYPETHPEALNPEADFKNFVNKVSAGADGAITQFFFEPEPFFNFVENCEKKNISIPVVPGVMPIHNAEALLRMAKNCGTKIPLWLKDGLKRHSNEEDLIKYGIDIVTNLCEKLLNFGVPGIHFYTINRDEPTNSIIKNLNLKFDA